MLKPGELDVLITYCREELERLDRAILTLERSAFAGMAAAAPITNRSSARPARSRRSHRTCILPRARPQ